MINNAITLKYRKYRKYKKDSNNINNQININGKQILKTNKILNRLEINSVNNDFITLKDH